LRHRRNRAALCLKTGLVRLPVHQAFAGHALDRFCRSIDHEEIAARVFLNAVLYGLVGGEGVGGIEIKPAFIRVQTRRCSGPRGCR
jgi:hypothetical protein